MSGTVIVGSGGGHAAVKAIAEHFPRMPTADQTQAVMLFKALIAFANAKCGTTIDPDKP